MSWNHFNEDDWKDFEYGWIKYVAAFVVGLIIIGICAAHDAGCFR